MPGNDSSLLREALAESTGLAHDLWAAYRDQMERTSRLMHVVSLGLAGELGVVTLVVQAAVAVPSLAAVVAGIGFVATLLSGTILVVAQVNLPSDALWSWGSTPGAYASHARAAGHDDDVWVTYLIHGLAKRVHHNAQVIVVLVRRRNWALVLGGLGIVMFLTAVGYIVGGALLA